ncbi:thymidine phosphorylase [Nioella nitratireducens]|uniref:thymidine phosphorylase n=1 Tax=Nioella nitratireducens TaxID=1287720 RepID=UPI0008FCE740|nr:thymidine phosphorylase [Nioella nitratireducens]
MDARAILAQLRRGEALSPEAYDWFARGLADGGVSDAQAGAFAMGICKSPIGSKGRVLLTHAMRATGQVLAWNVPGPVLDKHSTGGVGDTVSLPLAPALAACGAFVPMLSGRGLGHTGGTLDKMEAIPGYRAIVSNEDLSRVVREVGCAIVGASGEIAPADKRLYAVRDVTATVESIDLITASILSKKLSEGLDGLVLDVKTGSGAFMEDPADALALAQSLVDTAQGAGCNCTALLTDMSQPLARSAGNALEVIEAMELLTGTGGAPRLREVTVSLGGELLALGGLATDAADGEAKINGAINSGRAADVFGRMVAALGGPSDFVARWRDRLPAAPVVVEIHPGQPGYVASIDTRAIGEAVVHLGGGRLVQSDAVDPAVGLSDIAGIGDRVEADRPLARIHARSEEDAHRAAEGVVAAYRLSDARVPPPALVQERIA